MSEPTGRQTGLGTFDSRDEGSEHREGANGKMDEILSMDDAVDELAPVQVMDVWVRGKLMRDIVEQYEEEAKFDAGPTNPMERAEDAEAALSAGANPYGRLAGAGDGNDPDPILARKHAARLRERSHRENVEALFDDLTREGAEVSEGLVELARKKVKTALSGCGMPRINVQRDAVQYYRENPGSLAPEE